MNPRMFVQRDRERRYTFVDLVTGATQISDDPEKATLFSEFPDEYVVWTRESLKTSLGPRG